MIKNPIQEVTNKLQYRAIGIVKGIYKQNNIFYSFTPAPFRKVALLSNCHLGSASKLCLSNFFFLYLSSPASAIIAALSVHNFKSGK